MTRNEQERLVRRYVSGEMSTTEEQAFFIEVAVRDDLRQTLKAYQVVETALRKHRDAMPSQPADARPSLIAMLGAAAAETAGPDPAPPRGDAAQRRGGPSIGKWGMLGASILIAVVGTLLLVPEEEVGKTGPAEKIERRASERSPRGVVVTPEARVRAEEIERSKEQEQRRPKKPADEPRAREAVLAPEKHDVEPAGHDTLVVAPAPNVTRIAVEPAPRRSPRDTIRVPVRIDIPEN